MFLTLPFPAFFAAWVENAHGTGLCQPRGFASTWHRLVISTLAEIKEAEKERSPLGTRYSAIQPNVYITDSDLV